MQTFFDVLQFLSSLLPTGLIDPRAAEKMARERAELDEHCAAGDRLGATLEAGDVAYYAAKSLANNLITQAQAEAAVTEAAQAVGLDVDQVLRVAVAKYLLRSRPNNPKDDATERAVARHVLGW